MRVIFLDATKWERPVDFYKSLLIALESPSGHGLNINALIDSMVYGGINGVEPPYLIQVQNTSQAPEDVMREVKLVEKHIPIARNERMHSSGLDCDIKFEVC